METSTCTMLRGSMLAVLAAGSFCVLALAAEDTTVTGNIAGSPQVAATTPEEESLPVRGVLNNFSNAVNEWYSYMLPHLQKVQNLSNLSHPVYPFKVPGISSGSLYTVSAALHPVSVVPVPAGGNTSVPRVGNTASNKFTKTETATDSVANTEADAALLTALNAFHQYVDNFISYLSAKLSPFLMPYPPGTFFPFLPPPFPVPMPAVPSSGYVMPSPLTPVCAPGEPNCVPVQADAQVSFVPTPIPAPPMAPDVDMSAIVELLGRFGDKLSPTHILTLQPFMEHYFQKLSATSKAALRPLLMKYWPHLFPTPIEAAAPPETAEPTSLPPLDAQENIQQDV